MPEGNEREQPVSEGPVRNFGANDIKEFTAPVNPEAPDELGRLEELAKARAQQELKDSLDAAKAEAGRPDDYQPRHRKPHE